MSFDPFKFDDDEVVEIVTFNNGGRIWIKDKRYFTDTEPDFRMILGLERLSGRKGITRFEMSSPHLTDEGMWWELTP